MPVRNDAKERSVVAGLGSLSFLSGSIRCEATTALPLDMHCNQGEFGITNRATMMYEVPQH
jgi:hypothetical protein